MPKKKSVWRAMAEARFGFADYWCGSGRYVLLTIARPSFRVTYSLFTRLKDALHCADALAKPGYTNLLADLADPDPADADPRRDGTPPPPPESCPD